MWRKTNPRVRDGRVQRKNRSETTRPHGPRRRSLPDIHREHPGRTYRHVVDEEDVRRLIALLPDWGVLSAGLEAIVLAQGDDDLQGWYRRGIIGLCAWDRDLEQLYDLWFVEQHAEVLEMLDVPVEREAERMRCRFDEGSARDFSLLHVFLHEVGHHVDLMSTQRRRDCPCGEPFAESWAVERGRALWPAYARAFPR